MLLHWQNFLRSSYNKGIPHWTAWWSDHKHWPAIHELPYTSSIRGIPSRPFGVIHVCSQLVS